MAYRRSLVKPAYWFTFAKLALSDQRSSSPVRRSPGEVLFYVFNHFGYIVGRPIGGQNAPPLPAMMTSPTKREPARDFPVLNATE